MKLFRIAAISLLAVAPAYAGPVDAITFFKAPVLSEAGLLALAVVTGLAGIRLVNRYHKK